MAPRSSTTIKKLLALGPEGSSTADYLESVAQALRQGTEPEALSPRQWQQLGRTLDGLIAEMRSLEDAATATAAKKATATDKGDSKEAAAKPPKKAVKAGPPPPATSELWKKGPIKSAKVYVDGASRGNPGPASGGIFFTTMDGAPLHDMAVAFPGDMTNNQAEYETMAVALGTARAKGIESLFVFADSELMVKQMTGVYRIKNPDLAARAARSQALRKHFRQFSIVHVRRADNARADELANWALDHPEE